MSKKRIAHQQVPSPAPVQTSRWRRLLLLLTLVPMIAGVLLFVGAWAGVVVFDSSTGQTVAGAWLALLGFAASNALQAKWWLAGGWTALGIAIALLVGQSDTWARLAGVALGVIGLLLLTVEFTRRFRASMVSH